MGLLDKKEIKLLRSLQPLGGDGGSGAGGWVTAYEVDFTTLPAQTLATDGDVAILNNVVPSSGTTTFVKAGSAGETHPTAIVPGVGNGLIFQPEIGGGPSLTLASVISSLLPQDDQLWSTAVRIWISVTQSNAVGTEGTFGAELFDISSSSGYVISDAGGTFTAEVLGSSPDWVFPNERTLASPAPTGFNVYMFEVDGLDSGILKTHLGTMVGGAFPSAPSEQSSLWPLTNIVGNLSTADASFQWIDPTAGTPYALENLAMILAAEGNGQTGFKLGIGRLRVDYKI